MRYFANPSRGRIADAMSAGLIGCIETPRQGKNRVPPGAVWCADTGIYGKGYPGDEAWWSWLEEHPGRERCAFATAPDVVGDAAATLERSRPWLAQIRGLGIPVAFVAQDGFDEIEVPWDDFDVLFLGGTDDFKLGPVARAAVAEARRRGLAVHMGRVNSYKRLSYADAIGCDSADGTYLIFAPAKNLPMLLGWLEQIEQTLDLGGVS